MRNYPEKYTERPHDMGKKWENQAKSQGGQHWKLDSSEKRRKGRGMKPGDKEKTQKKMKIKLLTGITGMSLAYVRERRKRHPSRTKAVAP